MSVSNDKSINAEAIFLQVIEDYVEENFEPPVCWNGAWDFNQAEFDTWVEFMNESFRLTWTNTRQRESKGDGEIQFNVYSRTWENRAEAPSIVAQLRKLLERTRIENEGIVIDFAAANSGVITKTRKLEQWYLSLPFIIRTN